MLTAREIAWLPHGAAQRSLLVLISRIRERHGPCLVRCMAQRSMVMLDDYTCDIMKDHAFRLQSPHENVQGSELVAVVQHQ